MAALVKAERGCVLHLCSSIQVEMDPVEVKEELMPLISPAVTWGRKEEEEKTRKRLMYNAESALEPVGNNSSLYLPSAPLLFILHFYLCLYVIKILRLCTCVHFPTCRYLILAKPLLEKKKEAAK